MERKLSTIFASDVVGFSKMMAVNEEMTLKLLQQRRLVIDGVIAEHGGTIFGSAGDSVIAAFAACVGAGADMGGALTVANAAAAVTVRKLRQTGTASPAEIEAMLAADMNQP